MGAIITVLAIALDPLSQQLIQLDQRVTYNQESAVRIVRSNRYSKGTEKLTYTPKEDGYAEPSPHADLSMQSAILYGLAQSAFAVVQQTQYQCPSGDCSWDSFPSLSVCSQCNDVSNQLIRYQSLDFLFYALTLDFNIGLEYNLNATTFQLPNGLLLSNRNGLNGGQLDYMVYMTTYGTGNTSNTITFKDNDSLIWSLTILKMADSDSASAVWPDTPIEALECGLYYCVKEFTPVAANGTLQENEILLDRPRVADSWQVNNPDYTDPTNWTSEMYNSLEYNNITGPFPRTDLMLEGGFNISQKAVHSISAHFQNTFIGESYVDPNRGFGINSTYKANLTFPMALNGWYHTLDFKPSMEQSLYETSGLNETFRCLARSMSNAIRAGDDNHTESVGHLGIVITYFKIEWPWIALHVLVVLAGGYFLTITIYETKNANVPIWKSSLLPLLSLDTEARGALAAVESIPIMEQIAAENFVRFFRYENEQSAYPGFSRPKTPPSPTIKRKPVPLSPFI